MGWFKKKDSKTSNYETTTDTKTSSGLSPLPAEKIKEIIKTYYQEFESDFWNEIKEEVSKRAVSVKLTEDQMLSNLLSTSPFYDAVVVLDSIVVGFMGSNEYYVEAEAKRVSGEHLGKSLGTNRPTMVEYPEIMVIAKALKPQLTVKKNMSNVERDKMINKIMLQTLELHNKNNDKGDSGELTSAIWQAFSQVAVANLIDFDIRKGLGNNPLVFSDYLQKIWHLSMLLSLIYYETGRDKDTKVKEFLGIDMDAQTE